MCVSIWCTTFQTWFIFKYLHNMFMIGLKRHGYMCSYYSKYIKSFSKSNNIGIQGHYIFNTVSLLDNFSWVCYSTIHAHSIWPIRDHKYLTILLENFRFKSIIIRFLHEHVLSCAQTTLRYTINFPIRNTHLWFLSFYKLHMCIFISVQCKSHIRHYCFN